MTAPEQKLRVLAIAPTAIPMSGWGRYAYAVKAELKKRGADFTLLAATPNPKSPKAPTLFASRSPFYFLYNIYITRKLARKADIVHAFDIWPFGVYGYFATLGTGKKLFMTGVATYSIAPEKRGVKRKLMELASKRAKAIFSVSTYTKMRIYKRMPTDNNYVVYWGASSIPNVSADRIAELRTEYDIPETASPILLTVGQMKHRKGQLDVVRAVKRLRSKYPNILYTIVGSNSDTAYVEKLYAYIAENGLEKNVRLLSNVRSDEELAFFYTIADIFLLTSNNQDDHFEGFGLVFLEAEQFGKPVIGTKDCGVEEAQQPGYNGYLVRQGDDAEIAEKVTKILEGDTKLFGEHSKEFASRFTWAKTVSEYIRHYRS